MLTPNMLTSMQKSVLCWLATVSKDGIPNVSPKEIFTHWGDKQLIIANIASPQSLRNIQENPNVCVSFIDILVQKGFQLKGIAEIIKQTNPKFSELAAPLLTMTQGNFPFASITQITIRSTKPIIAPRYLLYPDTTEVDQIEQARKVYGL